MSVLDKCQRSSNDIRSFDFDVFLIYKPVKLILQFLQSLSKTLSICSTLFITQYLQIIICKVPFYVWINRFWGAILTVRDPLVKFEHAFDYLKPTRMQNWATLEQQ